MPYRPVRAIRQHMRERSGGRTLNISSMTGFAGVPASQRPWVRRMGSAHGFGATPFAFWQYLPTSIVLTSPSRSRAAPAADRHSVRRACCTTFWNSAVIASEMPSVGLTSK